jgi:outer membrane protein OmpA-like peptidoglycan-associated protein
MNLRSDRRGAGSFLILGVDFILLLLVLGVVLHTLTTIVMSKLAKGYEIEQKHWSEIAADPCVATLSPPVVPALRKDADPEEVVQNLIKLQQAEPTLWKLYQGCQEPQTLVISEDLLHFKVNKFDDFESPPQPAYEKICSYVTDNLKQMRTQVYVRGFTDDTFTDEYNFELSYRRALHVMGVIQQSCLSSSRVSPGTKLRIFPIGMGRSELLQQQPGEDAETWRRRCRRIELSFRAEGLRPHTESQ